MTQRRAKFWKQEAEFVDSCLECIKEGDMEKELEMEMNPKFFPNKRAKHKVPENFDSSNVVHQMKTTRKIKQRNKKQQRIPYQVKMIVKEKTKTPKRKITKLRNKKEERMI